MHCSLCLVLGYLAAEPDIMGGHDEYFTGSPSSMLLLPAFSLTHVPLSLSLTHFPVEVFRAH